LIFRGWGCEKLVHVGTYDFGGTDLETGDAMVHAAVKMNMRTKGNEQEISAASNGVDIGIKTSVYVNDGAKNWPTVLATNLCANPKLAVGTRDDLATLITAACNMSSTAPFMATRLSRALSNRSKSLVDEILAGSGYSTELAITGVGIRDAVRAGINSTNVREVMQKTTFHIDGIELGNKWYGYERINSYETGNPWYCLGVRFAGNVIPLSVVLAIRGFGIGEFLNLDGAAKTTASPEQIKARDRLLSLP
jgi:hypothetical protein